MGRRHSTPRHPELCGGRACDAAIWFKLVDGPGPRPLRLPLRAEPDAAGTVAASERDWEHGRFLAAGEALRDGEQRWRNHFDDCPDAAAFKQQHDRRHGKERAVREAGQPAQLALSLLDQPEETR